MLITITVEDPELLLFSLQPTGLKFSAEKPAELKIRYAHADDDFNEDGDVDGEDSHLETMLGISAAGAAGPALRAAGQREGGGRGRTRGQAHRLQPLRDRLLRRSMIAPTAEPDLLAILRALLGAGRYREVVSSWLAAPAAEGTPERGVAARGDGFDAAGRRGAGRRSGSRGGGRDSACGRTRTAGLRAFNLLGAVAFERGALDDAASRFEMARALARQLGDTLFQAHAANNLASVAHLRGDAVTALSLYRAALLGYQRLGDRRGTAQTFTTWVWHSASSAPGRMRMRRRCRRCVTRGWWKMRRSRRWR